jgi:hypothetical protein
MSVISKWSQQAGRKHRFLNKDGEQKKFKMGSIGRRDDLDSETTNYGLTLNGVSKF